MKKRYIMSAIGAMSASAVAAYLLSDEESRTKLMNTIESVKEKMMNSNGEKKPSTLEAAGIPDQTAYADETLAENADMISEGSMYGVNYFNEVRDDETKNI